MTVGNRSITNSHREITIIVISFPLFLSKYRLISFNELTESTLDDIGWTLEINTSSQSFNRSVTVFIVDWFGFDIVITRKSFVVV